MNFIDDLTPKFYKLVRIGIERDGDGDVIALADVLILGADGGQLVTRHPSTMLTSQEKQALGSFVNRELGKFETATGLTEWIPPEEP